jgi:hypothetical protein
MPRHHLADDDIRGMFVDSRNFAGQRSDLVFRYVVDAYQGDLLPEAVECRRLRSGDQDVVVVRPLHAAKFIFPKPRIANQLLVRDGDHENDSRVAFSAYVGNT